jgi:UDP-glucose:(heptosyl)LPS alpha-1,3-glucosyltransferase
VRIGISVEYLDPQRGGAEHWTFQHVQGLLARGHEVHVVTQEVSAAAAQLPIAVHRLGRLPSVLVRAEAAEKMLRSLRLDLVHDIGMGWYCDILQSEDGSRMAQWEQRISALPGWLQPLKRGLIRALPRYRDFRRLMARQYGDPGRIVLAVSKMCAQDYVRYHQVPLDRIRVVYHGADPQRFSPEHRHRWRIPIRRQLGIREDEVVLLFVGHDYRRKGLTTAVRAVRRLVEAGAPARLLVVGGNRRSLRLRRIWERQQAVTLVGAVADPVPYYAAADVFVLPTLYDPCSLSVTEAAASGLPCVTSRFNGAAELLTEGVDSFVLADPADDRELADRLGRFFDPAVRRSMGEAARQLALRHSSDHNCDQIVAVYHEIVRSARRAA